MYCSCKRKPYSRKPKKLAKNHCRRLANFKKIIAAISTDNAANTVAAVREFGWHHLPCFAHTQNPAVTGAIKKNVEFNLVLEHFRKLVFLFKQSNLATSKLNFYCANITKKKLKQEVPTRWNSTLLMMMSLLELKEQVSDTVRILKREELDLTNSEWDIMSRKQKHFRRECEQLIELCQYFSIQEPSKFLSLFTNSPPISALRLIRHCRK